MRDTASFVDHASGPSLTPSPYSQALCPTFLAFYHPEACKDPPDSSIGLNVTKLHEMHLDQAWQYSGHKVPQVPTNSTSVPYCSISHVHSLYLYTPNSNPQLLLLRQASWAQGERGETCVVTWYHCRVTLQHSAACSVFTQTINKTIPSQLGLTWLTDGIRTSFSSLNGTSMSLTYKIGCSHHASEDRPI